MPPKKTKSQRRADSEQYKKNNPNYSQQQSALMKSNPSTKETPPALEFITGESVDNHQKFSYEYRYLDALANIYRIKGSSDTCAAIINYAGKFYLSYNKTISNDKTLFQINHATRLLNNKQNVGDSKTILLSNYLMNNQDVIIMLLKKLEEKLSELHSQSENGLKNSNHSYQQKIIQAHEAAIDIITPFKNFVSDAQTIFESHYFKKEVNEDGAIKSYNEKQQVKSTISLETHSELQNLLEKKSNEAKAILKKNDEERDESKKLSIEEKDRQQSISDVALDYLQSISTKLKKDQNKEMFPKEKYYQEINAKYYDVLNRVLDDETIDLRMKELVIRPLQDVEKVLYQLGAQEIIVEPLLNEQGLHTEFNIAQKFPQSNGNYMGISKLCCGFCDFTLTHVYPWKHRGTHGTAEEAWYKDKNIFIYQAFEELKKHKSLDSEALRNEMRAQLANSSETVDEIKLKEKINEKFQKQVQNQHRRLSYDDFELNIPGFKELKQKLWTLNTDLTKTQEYLSNNLENFEKNTNDESTSDLDSLSSIEIEFDYDYLDDVMSFENDFQGRTNTTLAEHVIGDRLVTTTIAIEDPETSQKAENKSFTAENPHTVLENAPNLDLQNEPLLKNEIESEKFLRKEVKENSQTVPEQAINLESKEELMGSNIALSSYQIKQKVFAEDNIVPAPKDLLPVKIIQDTDITSFDSFLKLVRHEKEIDKVSSILEKNPNFIDRTNKEDGWGAIHSCAAYGGPNMLQNLVNFKADINQFADGYYTPALIAAKTGNLLCLKKLIDLNADVTITNMSNRGIITFLSEDHEDLTSLLDVDIEDLTYLTGEDSITITDSENLTFTLPISNT